MLLLAGPPRLQHASLRQRSDMIEAALRHHERVQQRRGGRQGWVLSQRSDGAGGEASDTASPSVDARRSRDFPGQGASPSATASRPTGGGPPSASKGGGHGALVAAVVGIGASWCVFCFPRLHRSLTSSFLCCLQATPTPGITPILHEMRTSAAQPQSSFPTGRSDRCRKRREPG